MGILEFEQLEKTRLLYTKYHGTIALCYAGSSKGRYITWLWILQASVFGSGTHERRGI